MNRIENIAWNQFEHTGKIQDYLAYCQQKQQPAPLAAKEGSTPYATNTGRDRSTPVQNRFQ